MKTLAIILFFMCTTTPNYTTATYSITQTYNGETSSPVYTTVTKTKR